jgi:ubiquinone/menaquinone biosynthesis C-methylase UbiE
VFVSYDAIASDYDEFVGVSRIHRVAVPSILELCAEGDAVLDVACGQGVLTRELGRQFPMVVGVDRSRELIRIAEQRDRAPHVRYLTEDAEALGSLADASFDGATCCLAMTDFDDLSAVLAATHLECSSPAAGSWSPHCTPASRRHTQPTASVMAGRSS